MFVISDADAAAIRAVFHQRGELSATVELRRLFPGLDAETARECARTIAGWEPHDPGGGYVRPDCARQRASKSPVASRPLAWHADAHGHRSATAWSAHSSPAARSRLRANAFFARDVRLGGPLSPERKS